MKTIVILLSIIVFTGCTTTITERYETEYFWKQNKISYNKAKLDYDVCISKANAAQVRQTKRGGLVEACMELKGYKWGKYVWKIYY